VRWHRLQSVSAKPTREQVCQKAQAEACATVTARCAPKNLLPQGQTVTTNFPQEAHMNTQAATPNDSVALINISPTVAATLANLLRLASRALPVTHLETIYGEGTEKETRRSKAGLGKRHGCDEEVEER